jgi:hypothetical protein
VLAVSEGEVTSITREAVAHFGTTRMLSYQVNTEYAALEGLVLLTQPGIKPSTAALEQRWSIFTDLWQRSCRED